MGSLTVFGKAKLERVEFMDKANRGCSALELHLSTELISGSHEYETLENVFDLGLLKEFPVKVVHAPFINGQAINIEDVCDMQDIMILNETFRLAQLCSNYSKEKTLVVMHCALTASKLEEMDETLGNIAGTLMSLTNQYKDVEIGIENVPIFNIRGGRMVTMNNFLFDNVEIASKLNSIMGSDKVGTVLDTCHAMLTKKYIGILEGELGSLNQLCDLEHYFRANEKMCKLIHLCDYKENGLGKNHGVAFDKSSTDSLERLITILEMYKKYQYSCPVTLEILEDDYGNSVNFTDNLELVNKLMKG